MNLVKKGISVSANVQYWPTPHETVISLIEHCIDVGFRGSPQSIWGRGCRKIKRRFGHQSTQGLEKFIGSRQPALVVLSCPAPLPPLEYMELCAERNWPFITIGQWNDYQWCPSDEVAEKYRKSVALAQRCYFVSDANRRLAEIQLG